MDGKDKLKKQLSDIYDDFWGSRSKLDPEELKEKAEEISRKVDEEISELRANLSKDFVTTPVLPGGGAVVTDKTPAGGTSVTDSTPAGAAGGAGMPGQDSGAAAGEAQAQEQAAAEEAAKEEEPEEDPMDQLNELVGLEEIKHDVVELINLVKVQKLRKDSGMKTVPVSLHLVFSGNPGTGKTTIARILASLYKKIGVLSKGQLVEVDRSALVAGFVGQTAIKTQEKIQEALGGVLFIDEAYTLVKEGGNDFGQEAIDTILKGMEDNRDDLVVIVAGYTELMEKFVNSNPGLKSRFNKYFFFADYTVEELMAIFKINCKKYEYQLDEEAEKAVLEKITVMEAEKGENFANARSVRNLFETIITNQATRVAGIENPTSDDIKLIKASDLEEEQENVKEAAEEVPEETAEETSEDSAESEK